MSRALPGAALAVLVATGAGAQVDEAREVARLGALDKVTARTSQIDVAVGETRRYGTLSITARACFEAPPTAPPESAAFLRIQDEVPGAPPQEVFSGWMFASSPALSALDHAVYDVWVVDCLTREEAEQEADRPPAARDETLPPRRRPEG